MIRDMILKSLRHRDVLLFSIKKETENDIIHGSEFDPTTRQDQEPHSIL